jgi:hypothetical protein
MDYPKIINLQERKDDTSHKNQWFWQTTQAIENTSKPISIYGLTLGSDLPDVRYHALKTSRISP